MAGKNYPIEFMSKNVWKNSRGSALLIAILITAVLLIIGLSINRLILREMKVERAILSAGMAYYAAEAGIEDGLYEIDNHIPGYQGEEDVDVNGWIQGVLSEANSTFQYKIQARDTAIPCSYQNLSDDIGFPESNTAQRWRVLKVQEAMRVPLYRYDSSARFKDFNNFKVSYYLPAYENLSTLPNGVEDVGDIIRWKITGLSLPPSSTTQAVGDFFPIFSINNNEAETATSFGTESDATYTMTKYYQDNQIFFEFDSGYAIATFLGDHDLPYLTVTNAVDADKQKPPNNHPDANVMHLRITSSSDELVCEAVKIDAKGLHGDFEQRLAIETNLDTFLPVFDFALYRTIEESKPLPSVDMRDVRMIIEE